MSDTCREVQELIPWVANGTANPGEQRRAFAHIAACADCRGDLVQALAMQTRLKRALQGLRECEMPWVPPRREPGEARDAVRIRLVRQLAALVRALGMPALAAGALDLALGLADSRPAISVSIPAVARFTATT
jgi:anti-sigma factor RsiW